MRIVPINEAEAIIEPFWDGGSSEHPGNKLSLVDSYTVTVSSAARAIVTQGWCAAEVRIDRAEPGAPVVTMERDCDLSVADYDIFRVFGSLPSWVHMTVTAVIDGGECLFIDTTGADTNDEFDGRFHGSRMTRLRLAFALTEPRPAGVSLMWLGLSNRKAQDRMESRTSPYTPDWPGALEAEPRDTGPEIGITFDDQGLAELRAKIAGGPMAQVFAGLREAAERLLDSTPEADIEHFVPKPDRRWCRNRDMKRKATAADMELLAFVGLLDANPEMSRMAARMALSAAHCDTWCESIMGIFPGATWHHRSFTEEIYCRGCALVLDWAGCFLTSHGKQIIRDAIVMKGLPRIESDFKRMEYIRHMNQGIVFSSGRIFGLLGVLPAHPRYRGLIEEAERDLHEMIGNYVHPDGGTLEGMAYWCYTFGTVMPLVHALARHHGQTLSEYATSDLIRTGEYALAMRSTAGGGVTYLGINDAHNETLIPAGLAAAYSRLSDRAEWKELYAALRETGGLTADIFHLIVAPSKISAGTELVRPRFDVLPDTGQVSTVQHDERLGHVLFHLCSGPTYGGHFHADKGSFIIEVEGETLACDRGVTNYDHPETRLIGTATRHNLLYPEHPDGVMVHQPGDAAGAVLTSALQEQGVTLLLSNNTDAWEADVFALNRRRICSPSPDLYLIDDEIDMAQEWAMSFRVNSRFPIREHDGAVWVEGTRARLRIVPLNWEPAQTVIAVEGIDDHYRPTNLLRMVTAPAATHRLVTAVEIVQTDDADGRWRFEGDERQASGPHLTMTAIRHDVSLRYRTGPGAAHLIVQGLISASCSGDTWTIEEEPDHDQPR